MAANNPEPELEVFNNLLKCKKSGPENDKKLCDLFQSLVKERNNLKEQLSLVEVRRECLHR